MAVGFVIAAAFAFTNYIGQLDALAQSPGGKGPAAKGGSVGDLRPSPLRWVDVHMHLVQNRGDFAGAMAEALQLMDRAGIAFAIVMPTPQPSTVYTEAGFLPLIRQHAGRFAWLGGGGDLNPLLHRTDPAGVTDAVRREFLVKADSILKAGARGFGEMSVLHVSLTSGHPFEQSPADHPLYLALADLAAERGVVIDMHIDLVPGNQPTPPAMVQLGNPRALRGNVEGFERLLAHNRRARIILEHVGADPVGFASRELLERLLDTHPNLFLAIRGAPYVATQMHNKLVGAQGLLPEWRELLLKHADRFVFGTDSFMVAPGQSKGGPGLAFAQRNVGKLIFHNALLAMIPPEVARKIAIENPRKLFALP